MSFDFPSPATAGQTFSPTGGPQYVYTNGTWRMQGAPVQTALQDAAADMSIGFKTSGNRFVVNDKSDLTGTDVMTVSETGAFTAAGTVTSSQMFSSSGANVILGGAAGVYLRPNGVSDATNQTVINSSGVMSTGSIVSANSLFTGATTSVILSPTSAGTVYLRPNPGSGTGQTTIDSAGSLTAVGNVAAGANFIGTAGNAFLNTTGAAIIGLRPNGAGVTTGQTLIDSTGAMSVATTVATYGGYSATGVNAGTTIANGFLRSSATVATTAGHHIFYNPNGLVGQITTNASATQYVTTSDERLKDVGSDYDSAEAIRIIREDPVKNFKWKAGNVDAVGWIAQRSYAVNEDLATRIAPREAGEKGEPAEDEFWGIDYGKRTPYLWAALTNALDRIDVLEAKIAALEAA